jgi:hypothetical protein
MAELAEIDDHCATLIKLFTSSSQQRGPPTQPFSGSFLCLKEKYAAAGIYIYTIN